MNENPNRNVVEERQAERLEAQRVMPMKMIRSLLGLSNFCKGNEEEAQAMAVRVFEAMQADVSPEEKAEKERREADRQKAYEEAAKINPFINDEPYNMMFAIRCGLEAYKDLVGLLNETLSMDENSSYGVTLLLEPIIRALRFPEKAELLLLAPKEQNDESELESEDAAGEAKEGE